MGHVPEDGRVVIIKWVIGDAAVELLLVIDALLFRAQIINPVMVVMSLVKEFLNDMIIISVNGFHFFRGITHGNDPLRDICEIEVILAIRERSFLFPDDLSYGFSHVVCLHSCFLLYSLVRGVTRKVWHHPRLVVLMCAISERIVIVLLTSTLAKRARACVCSRS